MISFKTKLEYDNNNSSTAEITGKKTSCVWNAVENKYTTLVLCTDFLLYFNSEFKNKIKNMVCKRKSLWFINSCFNIAINKPNDDTLSLRIRGLCVLYDLHSTQHSLYG